MERITIQGAEFIIRNGAVTWSNSWERIYEMVEAGFFRTESGGPETYGHTDFIITEKGRAAA